MKKHIIFTLSIALLALGSCKKFLDIKPKGITTLNDVDDYDALLNSFDLYTSAEGYYVNLADIADYPINTSAAAMTSDQGTLIYLWKKQFNIDKENANGLPPIYGKHYANIYKYNSVILNVDASNGSQIKKNTCKAEAKLGRALEYTYLINTYAKVYDATTANNDPGVPIIESIDVGSTEKLTRASVQAVYDYIIKDINDALPNLPANNNSNRYRGGVAAAHSVLARLYLYMGKYDLAKASAAKALSISGSKMIDYNVNSTLEGLQPPSIANHNIYVRNITTYNYYVNMPFVNSLNRNDKRYSLFYYDNKTYSELSKDTAAYPQSSRFTIFGRTYNENTGTSEFFTNPGTSAAEMHLIIAESDARLGNIADALTEINTFKSFRYTPDVPAYNTSDQKALIAEIVNERKLELDASMRWFDMRRLAKMNEMPTVYRYASENATQVIATLEPNSPRYVLQIPTLVIRLNPEMVQNP